MRVFDMKRRGRIAGFSSLVLGVAIVAGCGGDDDGGSSGKTASDEEYVGAMCDSFNTFTEDLLGKVFAAAASGGSEEEAEKKALEAAEEVFKPLVDDMKAMGVPKDVREYHDEMVKQLEEVLKAIEDGDSAALENADFGEDLEIPADIQERLQAVAEKDEDCADLALFES